MVSDLRELKDAYVRVASIVALFAVPAGVGIAMVADPVVRLAVGVKWLEAVPLIQLLAILEPSVRYPATAACCIYLSGRPAFWRC